MQIGRFVKFAFVLTNLFFSAVNCSQYRETAVAPAIKKNSTDQPLMQNWMEEENLEPGENKIEKIDRTLAS